jgi:hypothetical protein
MAQESRENWESALHIFVGSVPAQQRLHCQTVAKVVQARAGAILGSA